MDYVKVKSRLGSNLVHQQVVESLVIGAFPLQGLVTHYNAL